MSNDPTLLCFVLFLIVDRTNPVLESAGYSFDGLFDG